MLLIVHISIALASLIFSAYVCFRPSLRRLRASYILTGLMLATGTVLVIQAPEHLPRACTTGLFYLAVIAAANVIAHRRLAASQHS